MINNLLEIFWFFFGLILSISLVVATIFITIFTLGCMGMVAIVFLIVAVPVIVTIFIIVYLLER